MQDGGTQVAQTAKEMAGKAVVVKVDTEKYPQLSSASTFAAFPTSQSLPQESQWCNRQASSITIRWKLGSGTQPQRLRDQLRRFSNSQS